MAGATTANTTAESVERADRLAEMVAALSDCHLEAARNAVRRCVDESVPVGGLDEEDLLAIVATALVSVRHGVDLRDRS